MKGRWYEHLVMEKNLAVGHVVGVSHLGKLLLSVGWGYLVTSPQNSWSHIISYHINGSSGSSYRISTGIQGWSLPPVNHAWERVTSREDTMFANRNLFLPAVTHGVRWITEIWTWKYKKMAQDNVTYCYCKSTECICTELIWSVPWKWSIVIKHNKLQIQTLENSKTAKTHLQKKGS